MNLPEGVVSIRSGQQAACDEIVRQFNNGSKVVMLDAPTGSGKTLIGEMVRQSLRDDHGMPGVRGLYLCSTLDLQTQFARDFPDAKILRGRSNYATYDGAKFPELTTADCTKRRTVSPSCNFCGPPATPPGEPVYHCDW